MEYEGVDNDKNIAYYFEDLSININKDYIPGSESFYTGSGQFHTSIGHLHNSKSFTVVNTLANNAFKHWLTLNNITISPTTFAYYVFNSSTDSQYNNTQFKELFIDSGASTQSIEGINQFNALQQLDTYVSLTKTQLGWPILHLELGALHLLDHLTWIHY